VTEPATKKDVEEAAEELAQMTQRSFTYMQEHTATKDDVAEIVERIDSIEQSMATKEDMSRMEDRIDAKLDKLMDRFGVVIDEHEKRITVLERQR
jgi:alanine racemase